MGWDGQIFLTRATLAERHRVVWRDDLGLTGLSLEPSFAIGQRALLVPLSDGCLMWDCVPLATPEAIAYVRSLGGLKAIAISHPHYYGALADWSDAFGGIPVYLHADDRAFVTRPHASIVHWTGESHRISDEVLLLRTGGHFAGATMLHWSRGAEGRGALLTGDIAQVTMDRRFVSFMYSYPNYMPLNAAAVRRIAAAVRPLAFRSHLWRLVGPQHRFGRQGCVCGVRGAIYCGDRLSRCTGRVRLAFSIINCTISTVNEGERNDAFAGPA